jgi:hypothetical protein
MRSRPRRGGLGPTIEALTAWWEEHGKSVPERATMRGRKPHGRGPGGALPASCAVKTADRLMPLSFICTDSILSILFRSPTKLNFLEP